MLPTVAMLVAIVGSGAPCPRGECNRQPFSLVAAAHYGDYDGAQLIWQSEIVVSAPRVLANAPMRIDLAVPLAPDTLVESRTGVRPRRDVDERIVAMEVSAGAWRRRRLDGELLRQVSFVTRQSVPTGEEEIPLAVPLVDGHVVQKVVLEDTEDILFDLNPELGIERHVRHFVAQEATRAERKRCEALVGESPRGLEGIALFVLPTRRLLDAKAVLGTITPRAPHRRLVATSAVIGSMLLIFALGLVYLRLSRRAQYERSVAYIEAELRDLGLRK